MVHALTPFILVWYAILIKCGQFIGFQIIRNYSEYTASWLTCLDFLQSRTYFLMFDPEVSLGHVSILGEKEHFLIVILDLIRNFGERLNNIQEHCWTDFLLFSRFLDSLDNCDILINRRVLILETKLMSQYKKFY